VKPAIVKQILWWLLTVVCLAYSAFAFDMFRIELMSLLNYPVTSEVKVRSTFIPFLIHALLGGIGMVAGALQFNPYRSNRFSRCHRLVGWTYLITIWGTSLSGLWSAIYFDVPLSAKVIFWVIGCWWFLATTCAYWQIRKHRVLAHRNWMIRSFAISLFFISFPIWVPTLQTILPDQLAWPLGLFLAGSINMLVAEVLIHRLDSGLPIVGITNDVAGWNSFR